jgi:hypothetical protein
MPYIKKILQEKWDPIVKTLQANLWKATIGEVNFLFTKICKWFIDHNGENYENYDMLIGALECAKLELYRRKVAIYEDKKIQENGDVY